MPIASNLDEKDNSDEEEGDVISNLFRSHIVDNPMHKSSSFPLGFYPNAPIFDKYSDKEEEFKVYQWLLTNGITSSSTFQQKNDQQCVHAMVDNSYESIVQNTYEDPLISDTFFKDIIIGQGNQQFLHGISFNTHIYKVEYRWMEKEKSIIVSTI